MSTQLVKIDSVHQLHKKLGIEAPLHPLVSVVDVAQLYISKEMLGTRISTNLYNIALKSSSCGMLYGRNHYDFEDGALMFSAPHQVYTATQEMKKGEQQGWMLYFHADLIRTYPLARAINNYSFFGYDTHEALHLSEEEKTTVTDCVTRITQEYSQRIDNHSNHVIVATIELLLSYCARYYERQFNTRSAPHSDIVSRTEKNLREYLSSSRLAEDGPPSIQYLADKVHLSPNYLSDVLKKETGRSAKDHVNEHLIEKAKTLLLNGESSVSEVAYTLGFNYPHYFSRLFKAKTGMTPQKYRALN